ncbi:GSCOCG00011374001-RA-CDS [Cotesia congregata]|nr:GSCOCG00011374001-RA-CDS [Cotesia congregata]
MWPDNESYQENLKFFEKLKVVNDVAERVVALVEEYNKCLTKNEEQFQYLLQVVKEHRRKYPNCDKKTLQQI